MTKAIAAADRSREITEREMRERMVAARERLGGVCAIRLSFGIGDIMSGKVVLSVSPDRHGSPSIMWHGSLCDVLDALDAYNGDTIHTAVAAE